MLVTGITPMGALLAPSTPNASLSAMPVQPMRCGNCGCGGKLMALSGAGATDPLAALRGVGELG